MNLSRHDLLIRIALFIILILMALPLQRSECIAINNNIKVIVNGNELVTDSPPVIVEGRTMVPLRSILEALGANVEWEAEHKKITGVKGSTIVILHINDTRAIVNGTMFYLDVPPIIINNRTMIPVRFIAESLGADVFWDGKARVVNIVEKVTGTPIGKELNPKLVIPCQYEGYSRFSDGLAIVRKSEKYSVIDKDGKVITSIIYDDVFPITSSSNKKEKYFVVKKNGKMGIINEFEELIVPLKYDSIFSAGPGFAIVGQGRSIPPGGGAIDGVWGLINLQTGKEILPVKYNMISPTSESLLFIVKSNGNAGLANSSGVFVVPIGSYDIISDFNSGLAIVRNNKNYLMGAINKSGHVVIPIIYNQIEQFNNGVALAKKDNKYGVLDTSGKIVTPFIYDMGLVTSNGIISMREQSKTTIFDNTGKVIAPAGKYESFHGETGKLIYVKRNGKIGAIDTTGKEIVPFLYSGVNVTRGELAYVVDNDKAAVINQNGKVILPLDKYGLIYLREDGYVLILSAKNHKAALMDSNGKIILQYEYDSIGNMNNGYVVVVNQQGMAIFNKDGNMVIPFGDYDYIDYVINEDMVAVRKNGLYGYIRLR